MKAIRIIATFHRFVGEVEASPGNPGKRGTKEVFTKGQVFRVTDDGGDLTVTPDEADLFVINEQAEEIETSPSGQE